MIQQSLILGPIHTWLPGPMRISLGMTGDRMMSVDPGFGYSTRGIEERVKGLPFLRAQILFSRTEPESALILDRLFSEAVEEITGTKVSDRVLWIRGIAAEVGELNFQLKYLAKMASRMGLKIPFHAILKHRENLFDLLELLTGSRYGYSFVLPGGVRFDLTDGFQERLESWVRNFQSDYGRLEELLCWTHGFQNRLRTLGVVVNTEDCGFVSEAAVEDTRLGQVSHVESRLLFSLKSCLEIARDLEQGLVENPSGGFREPCGPVARSGEVQGEFDTLRGTWKITLALDSSAGVESFSVVTPSDRIRNSIVPALEGESIEDLPLILESLSLSVSEIDR